MKAVGYRKPAPVSEPDALVDFDAPDPGAPAGRDLRVRVKAVSVNPVDTKVRSGRPLESGDIRILGFDAAGVVEAVGPEATLFRPGDEVFYAGAYGRPGSNAEVQLVDERIVGPKPKTLSFAEAAVLPLTFITAWELLFDRLRAGHEETGDLLVVGGAGGVGSALIQLARRLTKLTVIATASRPETRDWVAGLGAHHVIDHTRPLGPQLAELGRPQVRYVASLTHSAEHFPALAEIVAPQGAIGVIEADAPLDVRLLKNKSAALVWEMMFARSDYETPDMIEQHRLLAEVARLVDAGVLRTTWSETVGRIDAATLTAAHARIESGRTVGKLALEGF
ncbi:zinc-binding alcohol dehydrogenase family protein [Caulobacter sp. 17J80-11]|uniref:zinc-binding alcohol dehydrogenase family protein n=1 Tax=Caulobacter sp. 17J80-11 TaxID=2763502 RepID=UPI001653B9A0|nr:zinc-binding alcohol dehydrogenase family protein [Caulobacter sp. 17J80-11]MBC6981112.1 zinc-binding alcohol dehydrogenase family protein [Caulobacter sp. 17J80-11]